MPRTAGTSTRWSRSATAEKIGAWKQLDNFHMRTFAAREHRDGLGPRSVQRRLSALRGFFNYLIRERVIESNPAADIRAPKAAKRLPKTLDVDQVASLLERKPTDTLSRRDLAMLELLYSSGLRLAELVGLDVGDLDLADRTVRVLGKGSKTRVLPVGSRRSGRFAPGSRTARPSSRTAAARSSSARTGSASARARSSGASAAGRRRATSTCRCTRTCSGIPSRRTCSSRAGTCAACRNFSATPTSVRHRSTPTLISSTWPASTTNPIRGPKGASN